MILFLDFDRALHACDNNHFREMNMTANDAQPMSQKQADALRREWALLLKMGYASQWTPAQKMARQDEIVALLLRAVLALMRRHGWRGAPRSVRGERLPVGRDDCGQPVPSGR